MNRKVKYRIEFRKGYETYEWKIDNISQLILEMPDLIFEVRYFGVIPPYHILNDILLSGESNAGMSGYAAWEPFNISESDYNIIVNELLNHPLFELNVDSQLNKAQNLNKWRSLILSKYGGKSFDINSIINKISDGNIKGLSKVLTDAGNLLFRFAKDIDSIKIKDIDIHQVYKLKTTLKNFIQKSDNEALILQALSSLHYHNDKEDIPFFLEILYNYTYKNIKLRIQYQILLFLNRIDNNRFPLYDDYNLNEDFDKSSLLAKEVLLKESLHSV